MSSGIVTGMTERTVAVLAASGTQGSAITSALHAAGATVHAVTRRIAALDDRAALTSAMETADIAVFTAPLSDPRSASVYAAEVAAAAFDAGVGRIVYNTNTRIPDTPTDAPGFETRRAALRTLQAGPVPVTVVEPAVYLDNLHAPGVLTPEADGHVLRYPIPAGLPVSWLAVDDLGRAVAAACLHGAAGQTLRPGTPARTADELAAVIGAAIGAPVRFESLDPALFEEGLAMAIGADAADSVASIYRWLTDHPDSTVMVAPEHRPDWAPQPTDVHCWAADHLHPVAAHS